MTSLEITLVRESFRKMAPTAESLLALFYARFFELEPALRRECRGAMQTKARTLIRTFGRVIDRLEQLEALRPALRRIGRRQAWRGAREEHYASAGVAFLWTLERSLGIEFTPPLRAAWNHCYVEIASAMLDGAAPRSLAA